MMNKKNFILMNPKYNKLNYNKIEIPSCGSDNPMFYISRNVMGYLFQYVVYDKTRNRVFDNNNNIIGMISHSCRTIVYNLKE